MRPEILFPLFAEITNLPGIGPRNGPYFERLIGGNRIIDALWHLPVGAIDRRRIKSLSVAQAGQIATALVTVDEHEAPRNPRAPYRVHCSDDTGTLELVFFNARPKYLVGVLPIGEMRLVSGKFDLFNGRLQITHPDYILPPEKSDELKDIEPVYPMIGALAAKTVGKAIAAATERLPDLPEWNDPELVKREGWSNWKEAITSLHHPDAPGVPDPASLARRRLAYDELLANQLALALVRERARRNKGRELKGNGDLRAKVMAALPYKLTRDQQTAITEILDDMAAPHAMLRLLQGDVGSGKTIVAFLAMLNAIEADTQAAILAPTEILAHQHYETIRPLCEIADVTIDLLTGRHKGGERRRRLEALASGQTRIAVGTHALFQSDVAFADLGLAVIDEQHRFGVHQRIALAAKGSGVDMLVMTATPIPRTLTLTVYGDMDVSRIVEKPPGRKPVDTRAVSIERIDEVIAAIGRAIEGGARAYWVCPLVEESDKSELAAAEARYEGLKMKFGSDMVGLVHGRMKAAEKDAVMSAFVAGDIHLLVATTVIEVGVDVPAATIMVIEQAERFGLAQLHQLRGRIGRGSGRSTCLLLRSPQTGATARARLNIMRQTDDGFLIAEEDLRLRGGGEVLGTRQSGLPEFRLADPVAHDDLMLAARDDARLILERDDGLIGKRGQALRILLYLFERDAAIKYLKSG